MIIIIIIVTIIIIIIIIIIMLTTIGDGTISSAPAGRNVYMNFNLVQTKFHHIFLTRYIVC